jgi:hypothetical protein
VDGAGNVILVDSENNCTRLITSQDQVSLVVGKTYENAYCHEDAEADEHASDYDSDYDDNSDSDFTPGGVAVDGGGNIIVADPTNHLVRLMIPQGQVSILAGTGFKGYRDGEGTVQISQWTRNGQ